MPSGRDTPPLPVPETALLPGPETALLPGLDQIRPPREHRRHIRGAPLRIPSSRRIAAAAAVGVVLVVTAATALAVTLTGNDNSPASAGQLPSAPSRHVASTQPSPASSPSPSASPSPSVSAPPAPPAALPVLTASLSVSGRGGSEHVSFQATNTGSAASGTLTAVIALPSGSSLAGGSGASWGQEDNGSADGTAVPLSGGWSCQPTSGGATCTHASLAAGHQAPGMLIITLSGSGACGQPVRMTVSTGSASATAAGIIDC